VAQEATAQGGDRDVYKRQHFGDPWALVQGGFLPLEPLHDLTS